MSWLSELADKAETLLNKIDTETASVLANEQNNSNKNPKLIENSPSLSNSTSVPSNLDNYDLGAVNKAMHVRRSGSLTASPKRTNKNFTLSTRGESDKHLLDLLNTTESENALHKNENMAALEQFAHSRQSSVSSSSSFFAVSDRETPGFTTLDMESSGGSLNTDQYVTVDQRLVEVDSFTSFGSHSNDGSENGGSKNNDDDATSFRKPYSDAKVTVELQASKECSMLRKEIASLNQEMSQVLRRAKEADKETHRAKLQLSSLSGQLRDSQKIFKEAHKREEGLQELLRQKEDNILEQLNSIKSLEKTLQDRDESHKHVHEQNQRLLAGVALTNNLHSDAVADLQEKVKVLDSQLERERQSHLSSREEFNHRISQFEEEQKTLSKELSDSQKKLQDENIKSTNLSSQVTSLKYELSSVRDELTDYKEKASRILQSKDKLILSLKEGGREGRGGGLRGAGGGGASAGEAKEFVQEEIEQLRCEKNLLMEEVEKSTERMKQLIAEQSEAEIIAQQEASANSKQLFQLQEELNTQRTEASMSHEELQQSQQELRSIKEELTRQRVSISTRLQERDSEIEKLQKQIAHRHSSSSSVSELETRIHGLTESLILKQNSIEALSTDKHSLQIQMERLQQQYQESQKMLNIDSVAHSSQDEVRNRVPSFLVESPFDGGVTRRVKKAYGTLDKFSIRLGMFIRRYPIARVFIILYMGLLHAWVMIVLFTYSPEIHGPDFVHTEKEGVAIIGAEG